MGALAQTLNASKPRTGGIAPSLLKILKELDPDDREAVQRALEDWDDLYDRFRVSAEILSESLTKAGHRIGRNAIRTYRKQMGYGR